MSANKPLKIAVVPLDDRPCNREQVFDLCRIGGIEVTTPPLDLITSLNPSFDYESLHAWIESALSQSHALVLSLDQYLYGGLIRSRKMEITEDEANQRLTRLDALLSRHPGIRIYLSHVLLRLSVTLNGTQNEAIWRNIFRYSVLADKIDFDPKLKIEFDELKLHIPAPLLEEYLAVRARNHKLNLAVVGMKTRPAFLLFGQEDCAEFGLHRREKRALSQSISKSESARGATSLILTGADELGSMLVMRAFMDSEGIKPNRLGLELRTQDPAGLGRISSYEDIPVLENFDLHLLISPFARVSHGQSARVRVQALAFGPDGQKDACFMRPGEFSDDLGPVVREFLDSLRSRDAFLDLTHANGANPAVMAEIRSHLKYEELSAFSAWNTTGNRIGTLIAHLSMREIAGTKGRLDSEADRWYLRSQLLDGFLYASIVRPRLFEECRRRKWNPWALGEAAPEASALAGQWMQNEARRLGFDFGFQAELPWPRIFEIRIR